MASNDQWPPVSSPSNSKGLGKGRGNGNKKPITNEQKYQILSGLNEMFQSTLDSEVILSVGHSCEWKLQACIDALIAISASADAEIKNQEFINQVSKKKNSKKKHEHIESGVVDQDVLKMSKEALKQQQEELKKFEKMKKNTSKNRMGSFRGSISKLDSSFEENNKDPWKTTDSARSSEETFEKNQKKYFNSPSEAQTNVFEAFGISNTYQGLPLDKPSTSSTRDVLKTKNESELCGLKVHYRTPGMETNSDDDDADVVIEEEVSNINIPISLPVNVSQFLSSTSQTSTQSILCQKTNTFTTASPPQTPKKTIQQTTIEKIKLFIAQGNRIMILLRGLPGSGKTVLSRSLIETTVGGDPSTYVFSTDDFFVKLGNGIYKHDFRKLDEAHSSNQRHVLNAIKMGITPIIIDNTNLQAWEMRPYAAMAVQRGYVVEILDTDTPWAQNVNELARKNTHGVKKEKIREMMNRYEHGLTGQKLCEYYGLKYPAGNSPNLKVSSPVVNEVDVLSAEDISALEDLPGNLEMEEVQNNLANSLSSNDNQFHDLLHELRERKESHSSVEDSEKKNVESALQDHHLLVLGAIGSERKSSLAPAESSSSIIMEKKIIPISKNGNVLSQCWDFTLMLDGETLHSCRESEGSPVRSAEIEEQDEEFTKEIVSEEKVIVKKKSKIQNETMKCAVNDFLKELAESLNRTRNLDRFSTLKKNSSVVITEIVEPLAIENGIVDDNEDYNINEFDDDDVEEEEDDDDDDDDDDYDDDDSQHSDVTENILSVEEENMSPDLAEKGIDLFETSQQDDEKIIESILNMECKEIEHNISGEDMILSPGDTEESEEGIELEGVLREAIPVTSTIGSIFNLIKTSILGGGNDEQVCTGSKQHQNEIKSTEFNVPSTSIDMQETIDLSNEMFENKDSNDRDMVDNPIAEIRAAMNSIDNDAKEINIDQNKLEFHSFKESSLNFRDLLSDDCSNVQFFEVVDEEKICQVENEIKKLSDMNSPISDEHDTENEDNINRITWRESPFPIADIQPLNLDLPEIKANNVLKVDTGTNTTYYDFNVSFIGGTIEPGYRLLNAYSRQINEGLPLPSPEPPALKLMLHKGSMTGGEFSLDGNLILDDEDNEEERLPKLMELFPHIPKDYLIEIYEKVEKDFEWAVELLIEGVPEYHPIKITENDDSGDDLVLTEEAEEEEKVVESQDNIEDIENKEMDEKIEKLLTEKEEEEEGATSTANLLYNLQEVNLENSDSASTVSAASVNRTLSTEDEKSADTDETIELNVGFEFIRALEKTVDNADFLVPDGFLPVIHMKKSMADELYALWIESMYQQLNARQELLEQEISRDAEFARNLDREQKLEEARASAEPAVPNLDEIMDMEFALATVENEMKTKLARETPDDMASRLSRQMLHESHPEIDPDTFNNILRAHNGNFRETFETIAQNTGKPIVPCDTRKKQKNLIDRVKEKSVFDSTEQRVMLKFKKEKINNKIDSDIPGKSRKDTQRQLSLRIENINKAQEMYQKGYPEAAAYYTQVARLHSKNIEEERAKDVSALVGAHSSEDTLDLHQLFVSEALTAVEEYLAYQLQKLMDSNKKSLTFSIITGWGARSNNGTSKIKPAVIKYLNKENIKFYEENPGCLRVKLSRKNLLL